MVRKTNVKGTTAYVGADNEITWLAPTHTVTTTIPATLTHKLYFPMIGMNTLNAVNGISTTYYRFNSARVAMRTSSTLYWIHGDHLGSASLTTDISGTTVSEMRYYPFGEVHWQNGTMPTDRTFTGQRLEAQSLVGSLMDYGARFYVPAIGRFLSADTIVPRLGNPQSLNRFSYAGNSPLNRLDPSGHFDISAFIAGFSDQYVDDLSLGLHSSMNVNVAERMRSDDSAEYNIGRVGGQLGALLFAGTEIGSGGTMAGGSIAAGGGCAVLTIGACAPIGAAVAVGGATVGVGMVGHGLLIAGKVLANGDPLTKVYAESQSCPNCGTLDPTIGRSQGAIARKQHVRDLNNVGKDGISAVCRACTTKEGTFLNRKVSDLQEFARGLGLDPAKAAVYTPEFGGSDHWSLFIDAFGSDGYLLPQYADKIDQFLRSAPRN